MRGAPYPLNGANDLTTSGPSACAGHDAGSSLISPYAQRYEVLIEDLRVQAYIGVNPGELRQPQLLVVTIRLEIAPCQRDDLRDTVDYRRIADEAQRLASRPTGLIETFAARLARWSLQSDNVAMAEVVIAKPGALTNALAKTRVTLTKALMGSGM